MDIVDKHKMWALYEAPASEIKQKVNDVIATDKDVAR